MLIRGVDINVERSGKGRSFIWGHGLTWNRALENEAGLFQWDALADVLDIVRYDARGHGVSQASYQSADYQWPSLAGDMLGIADAMGAQRFIAGGASMGCATAIYAALAAPERVDALVLAIPPTAWETRAAQASVYERMAQVVEAGGMEPLLQLFQARPMFPSFLLQALPGLDAIGLRHIAALPPAMVPALMRGAGASNLPPREIIATLDVPVLILAWADDAVHPLSTATELAQLLPQAELHIASTLDDVRQWPALLRTFVAGLSIVQGAGN